MMDAKTSIPIDISMAGVIVASFFQILPAIAAVLGIAWYCIQMYESRTIQGVLHRYRMKSRAKKLMKLKAKELVILAEIDALEKVRVAKAYAVEKVLEAKADAASGMVIQQTQREINDLGPMNPSGG